VLVITEFIVNQLAMEFKRKYLVVLVVFFTLTLCNIYPI